MSQHNRVVWSEGLFLRPQHFQQAERYLERLTSQRLDALIPYAAGFTKLQIDQELLKIGRLNVRMQLKNGDASPAYTELGMVRVVEKRADGRVVLDDGYVPACLDCRVSGKLHDYVKENHGLLRHRIQALADRVASPGTKGVADVSDFLLLQLCNRFEPVLAHFLTRSTLHPELFYRHCLELAGEISTYARRDRTVASFPPYRHEDLQRTFAPVIEEVRRGLTAVIEQNAVAIPIIDRGRGVFAGTVPDVDLLRKAVFVLAVGADLPPDSLRLHFPTQVKLGPPEKIRDLVVSHLPGIRTTPLPVAPRQIPYHAGYTYFELDRKSEYWKALEVSRVIAMHVAGDFPGLSLELWAIRD